MTETPAGQRAAILGVLTNQLRDLAHTATIIEVDYEDSDPVAASVMRMLANHARGYRQLAAAMRAHEQAEHDMRAAVAMVDRVAVASGLTLIDGGAA